jgi:hypothetical protein
MGPLFPRLHVSDAGKGGGPRAPPRNKMALYEQLTVPSNRFSCPAASARAAGASLVPSTSAAQVSRSLFALLSGSTFPSPGTQNSSLQSSTPVLTVLFAAEFSPWQTRQTSVLAFTCLLGEKGPRGVTLLLPTSLIFLLLPKLLSELPFLLLLGNYCTSFKH